MSNNEFSQTVASDFAPQESICEWCGKPAVQQLTMTGGKYHNASGFFCQACGEAFTRIVHSSSDDASAQGQIRLKPPTQEWAERNWDDIPIPLD